MKKIRVNITVDKDLLNRAKTKLQLFGGKLSTLFNAFLSDFVNTLGKDASSGYKILQKKMDDLEQRLIKLENKYSRL